MTLIIGAGGTGKSFFIGEVATAIPFSLVVAPTSTAAFNLDQVIRQRPDGFMTPHVCTIHSAFGFGLGMSTESSASNLLPGQRLALSELQLLIIDEVSLVRADLLDRIDITLREVKGRDAPFGGVKVILVGDPYQLPPVVPDLEVETLRTLYGAEGTRSYFFEARVVKAFIAVKQLLIIELTRQYRQTDQDFARVLNLIRLGTQTKEDLALLNGRFELPPKVPAGSLQLTTDRATAGLINRLYQQSLGVGETVVFAPETWTLSDSFRGILDDHPMNGNLELRVGGVVIFTKNDSSGRWRNGSRGVVRSWNDQVVVVETLDSHRCVWKVEKTDFQQYIPIIHSDTRITSRLVGNVRQFPLAGGYALTIHRAQALTLDRVVVGFGKGVFAPGQAYVALSRVRTLDGLHLLAPARSQYFFVAPEVDAFMRLIADEIVYAELQPNGALLAG